MNPYSVIDEDTLVYRTERPGFYGVLATKSHFRYVGDTLHLIRGEADTRRRPATLEDFENFRVRPEGHLFPTASHTGDSRPGYPPTQ
jgi:hypothetical protein